MYPFRFRWFRSLVRNNTTPIPKDTAQMWRERLSKIYVFMAFNCMGLVLYVSYKEDMQLTGSRDNKDGTRQGIERYGKMLRGAGTVHVIQIKGTTVTQSYEISSEEIEKAQKEKDASTSAKNIE